MRNQHYAELGTLKHGVFTSGLGSDSVVLLDGRMNLANRRYTATQVARQRGCNAYRLHYGTFTKPLQSWEAEHVYTNTEASTVSGA